MLFSTHKRLKSIIQFVVWLWKIIALELCLYAIVYENLKMSDSEFSSSESEEKIYIDNINPTPDNLFPLELNSHQYLPPLSSLKLSPKIKAQVRNLMKSAPAQELRKILFWQIYCKKLKDTTTTEVQDMLSALLSQSYASLMLLKIKERFEESLDIMPIIIGHSIHYELWDIFKHSQSMFDLRFCLDCYKLIYLNLLGIRVSDIFVRSATQRILGDHFMYYYSRKTKTKHPDKKHVLSKALEEKMEEFPGGKEFAKELFHNHPSYKAVAHVQKYDIETIQLEPSDQVLQDKVDLHSREPPVRKSFLDSTVEKTFNCVKLSPMLCGYIDSSTVNYI